MHSGQTLAAGVITLAAGAHQVPKQVGPPYLRWLWCRAGAGWEGWGAGEGAARQLAA